MKGRLGQTTVPEVESSLAADAIIIGKSSDVVIVGAKMIAVGV